MIFHTFGDRKNPAVLLLHGMLTPWQIYDPAIEAFSGSYYTVVPELDGHTEETASAFHSVREECEHLADFIHENLGGQLFLLAGLSMGGRIAAELARRPDLSVEHLVLDGAPLLPLPGFLIALMQKNYRNLLCRSRKRDPKTLAQAARDFLPERYLPYYLAVADHMEEASADRILQEVFSEFDFEAYPNRMRILFMHGNKGNELLSRKSAEKMKRLNPAMEIRCFAGKAHAELACFDPQLWIREVTAFIGEEEKGIACTHSVKGGQE